jgi:hypothetical protein
VREVLKPVLPRWPGCRSSDAEYRLYFKTEKAFREAMRKGPGTWNVRIALRALGEYD